MKEMGNLLAEGNGKDNGAINFYVSSGIIIAIVSLVLASLANEWAHFLTPEGRSILQTLFVSLSVIAIILGILDGIAVSKTVIKVYENGVLGKGLSKWFYLGDIRNFDFILAYDQISVDVNGWTLNIHSPGTYCKVYVSNGLEIQQTIYQHRQKLAGKSD